MKIQPPDEYANLLPDDDGVTRLVMHVSDVGWEDGGWVYDFKVYVGI